ncbi:hypothetical protein [Sphingomonas sp.]|uniref:hypothetical protein n=1 Tax=Sphingomonas sp. TaxID=28214 RepID=UPI003AFF6381
MSALLVAGVAVPPAFAQTGSILPDRAAETSAHGSDADRAHRTMNDYGVCLVKSRFTAVRRAIASPEGQVDGALSSLAIDDCLQSGELRMSRTLMRGAVFRALYIHDFGRRPPVAPIIETSVSTNVPPGDNPLRVFGRCVLGSDAANTRAFVLAVPATSAERDALRGLAPALARCVAGGQTIRFSRATLQGVLAEAAYRSSSVPVSN